MNISNVQLIDRSSGKCLGTPDLTTNMPGLMPCSDTDKTQRWDISNAYNNYGLIEKPYLTSSVINDKTEFITKPGKRIILANNNTGEKIDGTPIGYALVAPSDPVYSRNGQFRIDRTGNIKGVFNPLRTSATDTYYQPCLNVNSTNGSVGYAYLKTRPYDDDTSGNCTTQWDILYDCDPTTRGTMNIQGSECDRRTGKYKCKTGYYGKDCTFNDSLAENTAAAYNNFFHNCIDGITSGSSNPTNCDKYHKTQSWLPAATDTAWYNKNFRIWNLTNTDDFNFTDKETKNSLALINKQSAFDIDFNSKESINKDKISKISTDKINEDSAQADRLGLRNPVKIKLDADLAALNSQIATYVVPADDLDLINAKTAKELIQIGLNDEIATKNFERTDKQTTVNTLINTHANNIIKINRLRNQLGLPPITA